MKVLFVMEDSVPIDNGCPVRNRYLMEQLRQMGVDVVGVTSPFMRIVPGGITRGWEAIDGIRYHRTQYLNSIRDVSSPVLRWAKRFPMFLRYCEVVEATCRQEKPDVIHSITSYFNGNAANRAGARLGIPRLYEVRSMAGSAAAVVDGKPYSSLKYQTVWKLDKRAMLEATRVAPLSQVLHDELVCRGIPPEKMDVVHNAIDINLFVPRRASMDLVEKHNLANNIVIGYIGSIRNIEGLSLVVKAAPRIIHECPRVKFLIVGGGADLDNLKAEASLTGVANSFIFTGRVPHDQVLGYYSIIDIFTIPRVDELVNQTVAPLKPHEAMAMGRAVLASDVGGLAEVIQSGKTGLLFKAGDVNDLQEKLVSLVNDEQKRLEIGKAARQWIVANRQWKDMAERYLAIYAKTCGSVHGLMKKLA
jgi:glycosyltransferase involved in cell wall biosynthesis